MKHLLHRVFQLKTSEVQYNMAWLLDVGVVVMQMVKY